MIRYFLLSSLFASSYLFAQQTDDYLRFRRLSLEEGLSQSTINHIIQDQNGFLWIATEDGLNRYDGYGFYVYKYQPSDTNSIPNNFVMSLAEDQKRQCLWIATFGGGLARLDFRSGNFQRYYHRPGDTNSIADNYLYDILLDHRGMLWIGTRDKGIVSYDPDLSRFFYYQYDSFNPKGLHHARVLTLCEDTKRRLWIGSDIGLFWLDAERKALSEIALRGRKNAAVYALTEDHKGILWIGTDGSGLYRYDPATGSVQSFTNDPDDKYSVSNNIIRCLLRDSGNNLWIGTLYGLNRLNLANTKGASGFQFVPFYSDPSDIHSLSKNVIQTLFIDRFDNLWVGTNGGGLNIYSGAGRLFALYNNKSLRLDKGINTDVLSLAQDDYGFVWVGTWGDGLMVIDRNNNRHRQFRHNPANRQSIPENSVFALLPDTGGVMWVGTYNGLTRVQYQKDIMSGRSTFRHYPAEPGKPGRLNHPKIRCMMRSAEGKIWIGTYGGGINVFDPQTERFETIRYEPGDTGTISNDNIWVIHEDVFGGIWVGTYGGGLNRYQPSEKRWTCFIHDPYNPNTISNDVVLSIHSDSAGVWAGTRAGLNYLNRTSGRFSCYTIRHGLPNDVIYGILPDRRGHLWMSTNLGISKVSLNADAVPVFRNYDIGSGLQGNEFNIGAYFQGAQGEMFFGGINGFNSFYPDSIQANAKPPAVIITAFKKFDKTVLAVPAIISRSEIELNYKDNFISIEFTALDFTDPAKNRYAYMMEGFDEQWNYAGSERKAVYTNLDPGTYSFRVKGSNSDGLWNETGASIRLTIHPPFWKTWWAYSFYIVFLLSIPSFLRYARKRIESSIIQNQMDRIKNNTSGDRSIGEKLDLLTERQKEIFNLIIQGKSNKEIMDDLIIELSTLKTHINLIYKKLGIQSRKEARTYMKNSKL